MEIELECILPEEELEIQSFIMFLVETDPGVNGWQTDLDLP